MAKFHRPRLIRFLPGVRGLPVTFFFMVYRRRVRRVRRRGSSLFSRRRPRRSLARAGTRFRQTNRDYISSVARSVGRQIRADIDDHIRRSIIRDL